MYYPQYNLRIPIGENKYNLEMSFPDSHESLSMHQLWLERGFISAVPVELSNPNDKSTFRLTSDNLRKVSFRFPKIEPNISNCIEFYRDFKTFCTDIMCKTDKLLKKSREEQAETEKMDNMATQMHNAFLVAVKEQVVLKHDNKTDPNFMRLFNRFVCFLLLLFWPYKYSIF